MLSNNYSTRVNESHIPLVLISEGKAQAFTLFVTSIELEKDKKKRSLDKNIIKKQTT